LERKLQQNALIHISVTDFNYKEGGLVSRGGGQRGCKFWYGKI